ncbi:sensor histidine kinase [Natronobacterium texcoconense]|uniref:histidine kinase n=1 Tax=Natronobacterium texcoconense TaxID=1095778 RepID=A0A1H1CCF3_NATTX|nr:MEDS domain-containing protein [Natronobacterium texcoconense]SDQ61356.1 His Kinase A (phospho-acceptor) domain-containing protein [Natronobacterium texcoconense]
MSQEADYGPRAESVTADTIDFDSLTVESGLEALRSSPEFHGTVEPLDGLEDLETCEHIALFYRNREERFGTVTPFVRQGIEKGDRIMYVIDEFSESEILDEIRGGTADVDAALESGQLTFHSLEETYLRSGRFDADDMLEVYGDAIEEAKTAYPGLRVTASTNFILDEHVTIEEFMAYESRVNDLFEGEDCIALCHYDCEQIPAETLVDVVRTHPHLVYENTVCHNFYYTPPEKFLEPGEPTRDVEQMLNTLADRSQARAELSETVEELEESNERLRRFAYVASHDLQEPLRMISSYLQLLESRYGDDLDEEAQEFIDFAVDGSDRMREMVQGLLEYSRIDMADSTLESVSSERVLEDVLTDLQVRIEETDATVAVSDLPAVRGDESHLQQLFSNLVANAIKYSGDGPPRIEVTAEKQGSRCVFAVADDGIGIESDYTDQIFEVFNRLHSTDDYEGTGIGLALCRKIVDHHDGDIWVDSEPGEGTTFYFTLPTAA